MEEQAYLNLLEQNEQSFREFAELWDDIKYELNGYELFGQSEEDLIFRKLTGIDEFFDKGKIR